MAEQDKIFITGTGLACASGRTPAEVWEAIQSGQSGIGPISQWDATDFPCALAGEVPNFKPREFVPDRKLHKYIRRTDMLGIYASAEAIESSSVLAAREGMEEAELATFNDRTGLYVGSGGGNYSDQHDYFRLMDVAEGDLHMFGSELTANVTPMWLLRALPNNVLCHVGIRFNIKGANACITNHAVSGMLAVIEAAEGVRAGEADRAIAAGHDNQVDAQNLNYMNLVGLHAKESVRPFAADRDGSIFAEGAAAVVMERASDAEQRGASMLAEYLGSGVAADAKGVLAIEQSGSGVERAIRVALEESGLAPEQIGAVFAHGNGNLQSDATEAAALLRVFGEQCPPVTALKWAYGHAIAASGILDLVVAIEAMRVGTVPGIATLGEVDPEFAGLNLAAGNRAPSSDKVLIISRGFAGLNVAVVLRVPSAS